MKSLANKGNNDFFFSLKIRGLKEGGVFMLQLVP